MYSFKEQGKIVLDIITLEKDTLIIMSKYHIANGYYLEFIIINLIAPTYVIKCHKLIHINVPTITNYRIFISNRTFQNIFSVLDYLNLEELLKYFSIFIIIFEYIRN